MKKYLAEMFGTMFLVLLACGSAVLAGPSIGVLGIGLCFGLVLVCLCYLWGIKRSDLFVGRANDVKRFAVQ